MSYRERQRLADIQAAIDAISSHLQRGDHRSLADEADEEDTPEDAGHG